jgi:hypothetical protein
MTIHPDALRGLVGDLRQIASVRRFFLSDGAEADMEMLAFSTGGGLDFWVTAGRTLDIATISYRGTQMAWQSPTGFGKPNASFGKRSFASAFGGFLNTCGFEHIRQPAGDNPLHGTAPFMPARIIAYGEDWYGPTPILFCEGEVIVWSSTASGYRLRRRIEAPIGSASLRIRDSIEVIGAESARIYALYHFNVGFPLHRDGTKISLNGKSVLGPLPQHEESVATPSLHALVGDKSICRVNGAGGSTIEFRWKTDSLPWLQLWRDLRPGRGVLSIEPCSAGLNIDGGNEDVAKTPPGQSKHFDIEVLVR